MDALVAEELEGAELAHGAPVGAVGGEGDVGVVVEEGPGGEEVRAGGEGEVVGFEGGLGRGGGGEDDGGDLAELEVEEGAVLLG